jgi:hypothetical protein
MGNGCARRGSTLSAPWTLHHDRLRAEDLTIEGRVNGQVRQSPTRATDFDLPF